MRLTASTQPNPMQASRRFRVCRSWVAHVRITINYFFWIEQIQGRWGTAISVSTAKGLREVEKSLPSARLASLLADLSAPQMEAELSLSVSCRCKGGRAVRIGRHEWAALLYLSGLG